MILDRVEMFGQGMPEKCAENYRLLRKKGMTVRKTTDVIIATFCKEQRMPLLFIDREFIPFVGHPGLLTVLPET